MQIQIRKKTHNILTRECMFLQAFNKLYTNSISYKIRHFYTAYPILLVTVLTLEYNNTSVII